MHTVILSGTDLSKFAAYVRQGIAGDFGDITTAQIYIQDDGKLVLGANGYTSSPMGFSPQDLSASGHEARMNGLAHEAEMQSDEVQKRVEANEVAALANTPPEGSGNPYANVEDQKLTEDGTDYARP